MRHDITRLPGDGIGPEGTRAVVRIIECAGVQARDIGGTASTEEFADEICRRAQA